MEEHSQWRAIALSVLKSIKHHGKPPLQSVQPSQTVFTSKGGMSGPPRGRASARRMLKSLTLTVAQLACLIDINTSLCDKHVYLLMVNITRPDSTRCRCSPNEDTRAFIQGQPCPSVGKLPVLHTHIYLCKEIVHAKQTIRPYFSISFCWGGGS